MYETNKVHECPILQWHGSTNGLLLRQCQTQFEITFSPDLKFIGFYLGVFSEKDSLHFAKNFKFESNDLRHFCFDFRPSNRIVDKKFYNDDTYNKAAERNDKIDQTFTLTNSDYCVFGTFYLIEQLSYFKTSNLAESLIE